MLAQYFNWLFYTSLPIFYVLEIEIPANKTRKRLRLLTPVDSHNVSTSYTKIPRGSLYRDFSTTFYINWNGNIIHYGGGGGGYLDRGSTLLTVTGVWLTVCKEDTLETMWTLVLGKHLKPLIS